MPVDLKALFLLINKRSQSINPFAGEEGRGKACSKLAPEPAALQKATFPSLSQVEQEQPMDMFRSNTELGPQRFICDASS